MTSSTHDAPNVIPLRMTTARLLVRTLTQDDLPAILACYDHPDVGRYCAPVRWPDMDHALAWFHRRSGDVTSGRAKQLVIISNSDQRVVGTSVLFNIDTDHRHAEIGYALGREFWGRGYVNEAVGAVIDYAFAELKLHRLTATIDTRNRASAKVLMRLGFICEGTQRESYFDAGEFTDSGLYGLLAMEWRERASVGSADSASSVGAGDTPSS
jgi:[ribosomal protein S5]-alanine N-acetyltransferase